NIPSNYQVLFIQGGGTGQFAGVPLNLKNLTKSETADYLVTGSWSAKAAKEADKYLHINKVLNPPLKKYTCIPEQSTWHTSDEAAYFYYCSNETIEGVEFRHPPDTKNVPLVADISSNALSAPVAVNKHALLFAGSQKNLGTSGVTVVIVRDDLIGHADRNCPSVLDYKTMHQSNSTYNTPPVFCPI
uniref:phosphoserine transaminase n=1 Tax=Romanomermis culicivorax TaxID=13658 RepID=A0A915KWF0_ROMCU